jgi:hypothetical protein
VSKAVLVCFFFLICAFFVDEPELEDFFFSNCVPLRFTLATVYFKIRSFLSIVLTFNMILNVALAVGGTVLCIQFNLVTDLPLSLISTAVVFPISFGEKEDNKKSFLTRKIQEFKTILVGEKSRCVKLLC